MHCASMFVNVLAEHVENADVVENACKALSAVAMDEQIYEEILQNQYGVDGIEALALAFKTQSVISMNVDASVACCDCLVQLCYHDNLKTIIVKQGLVETLVRAKHQFANESQEIANKCEVALNLLAGGDP
eukprot:m.217925 g.217925  ORF g.217925 m.217925 type:complete len:131 (+) comp15894_c3_seq3:928-1320(+)